MRRKRHTRFCIADFLSVRWSLLLVLSSLVIPARAVLVTFTVDMSQQTVSPAGVYIAGSFQGWDPSTTPMINLGNGLWSFTADLPPGVYEFKFINGNTWGPDELVPGACGIDNGLGSFNRQITVGTDDLMLDVVCFGQCDVCTGGLYTLNGNAIALGGDCYAITQSLEWQNGTVWYGNQLDLGQPFDLEFMINFGALDTDGADGIVFALQRISSSAVGASGGGMGWQSFGTSFGIEFDTYQNLEFNDPVEDHVAMEINGDVLHGGPNAVAGPVPMHSLSANVEDAADHVVRITWDPVPKLISVYFDCELRLSANYDISANVFFGQSMVYWGFTGATGLFYNLQQVCLQTNALSVSEYTICPGGSIMLSGGSSDDGVYTWTPVDYLDDPSSPTPVASPLVTTTYTVQVTDLCNLPVNRQVTVNVLENDPACSILSSGLYFFAASADEQDWNSDLLSWAVSESGEALEFVIERSADLLNIEVIDTLQNIRQVGIEIYGAEYKGSGPEVYYRLRMLREDREIQRSDWVAITRELPWSVYNHPGGIGLIGMDNSPVCVRVYDATGHLVFQEVSAESSTIDRVIELTAGYYLVSITNDENRRLFSSGIVVVR